MADRWLLTVRYADYKDLEVVHRNVISEEHPAVWLAQKLRVTDSRVVLLFALRLPEDFSDEDAALLTL